VPSPLQHAVPNPPLDTGWYGWLQSATSADTVLAMAREFLDRWDPNELGKMPPHLRPGKLVDTADVTEYALDLVRQQQFTMDPRSAPQLHAMASFFSNASLRLSQLARPVVRAVA
jgi:hypothetical protein